MIARHGYLTLSRDRYIVIDRTRCNLDEGIVVAIDGGRLHANSSTATGSIPRTLIDKLYPCTESVLWTKHMSSTLATKSIGVLLAGTHVFIGRNPASKKITVEWVDRFHQQVIRVRFEYSSPYMIYDSYIVLMNNGYFVMPVTAIKSTQIRCYKLKSTDKATYLRDLLHYKYPIDSEMENFEEGHEAFCRNLPILCDVSVRCIE